MDYSKWYTRMIHTSNYRKQLRKEQKMDAEKQDYIVRLLEKNVDMPTRDIIKDYEEWMENRDTISMRHVQRIRKWFKENKKGETEMKEEDVFDTAHGMGGWELDLVNMANEGGWSVQSLAERIEQTVDVVKNTLTNYHYLITANVLDEEYEGVYFIYKDAPIQPDVTETVYGQATLEAELQENEHEQANLDGNDEFWEVEIDCVTACSKAHKEVTVFMNKESRDKAMKFMRWAKAREWLAYLVGTKDEDGKTFHVNDLYLPDQRTSASLVDKVVAEKYNEMKVIGVIHSHHEMGTGDDDNPSFSGHDANFINGNHDLSLLAGRDTKTGGFKIVGIGRVKTPCGSLMQVKANVKAKKENLSDSDKELMNEFKVKVFGKKNDGLASKGDKNGSYHFVDKSEMNL